MAIPLRAVKILTSCAKFDRVTSWFIPQTCGNRARRQLRARETCSQAGGKHTLLGC